MNHSTAPSNARLDLTLGHSTHDLPSKVRSAASVWANATFSVTKSGTQSAAFIVALQFRQLLEAKSRMCPSIHLRNQSSSLVYPSPIEGL